MRFRDRGAGALLLLALLLFSAGALSRFVPDTWPGAVVPRFAETIAPWLLIWALLVALLAGLFGARRSGGVLALCCLVAAGGMVLEHLRLSQPTVSGPGQLRVLFFNVLGSNARNAEGIARRVIEEDPDVAIFAEVEGIAPAEALLNAHYPHVYSCETGTCRLQVYSRPQLESAAYRNMGPLALQNYFSANLELEGREVSITAVHLLKPWLSGFAWEERSRLIRRMRPEGEVTPEPVLLMGDFNAPPWSSPMISILRGTGLRDLRWTPGTWPAGMPRLGVPLDHALVDGGLRLVSLTPFGEGLGSNHRGLLAEIVLEE